MPILGDASQWEPLFPDGLIPEILALVSRVWPSLPDRNPGEGEVSITRRFRALLIQDRNARRLPFRIERESVEDELEGGRELGRIDLRFTHGFREDVYFAFECKRLNVARNGRRRSMAGEYAGQDGLMRFLDGPYARGLLSGGMIGYVMDGDVRWAVRVVGRAINKRRLPLGLESEGLERCRFLPDSDDVKESGHRAGNRAIRIFHVFLPV